ncbi:hypothetical protein BJ138DRAFT_1001322 [Hygrophoropsis aurantiaca]|uniref:Uncharacterized protein n=1 Tax=Hygrophoropsis aurantiaca TaxID=72124 RepID=A0ACB8AK48_9AGAM|nr:hypothetical protein BJ138DRAFT_1001322 [Hygrophoropsis aurantiaca]
MGIFLAEEEKQAHHLKAMLRSTGDKLEHEIRRSNQTEARAEYAEVRVRELTARATAAETGKHYAEIDAARAREEIKRYQMQIESLEREIKRLQNNVSHLERQRNEADDGAARARDTARKFQMELMNLQSREQGRDEGRRLGMKKWFNAGRTEGWDVGRADGFEDGREEGFDEGRHFGIDEGRGLGMQAGRKIGRKEGYERGIEQGRREEREHALQAFDHFLLTEVDEHDHAVSRGMLVVKTMVCLYHHHIHSSSARLRRKGPKNLPSLPLSAFTGPNSGTSDKFPLPPTPSAVFPVSIIDAHFATTSGLQLQSQTEKDKRHGVVLTVQKPEDIPNVIAGYSDPEVLSVLLPFQVDVVPSEVPYLTSSHKIPTTLSTTLTTATLQEYVVTTKPDTATSSVDDSLKWALDNSRVVDISVLADVMANNSLWEKFEAILTKAIPDDKKGVVVLSNMFPPPHDLSFPTVKLMNHPTYHMYQSNTATLSLFPSLYVKLLPPSWDAPVPSASTSASGDQLKEWKQRMKMYIGPVLEAFGYERIIFGTAPAPESTSLSTPSDWYEIVRESFAELGVDQEAIDAVFTTNADKVYRRAS